MTASRMLVIAIDFGTTYSGYAFSFRTDFLGNPLHIKTINFSNKEGKNQYPKVPTSVLFTPDRKFHSFGHEAEEKYAEMAKSENKEEARAWYYFERFKMELYRRKEVLTRDSELLDYTKKKTMPVLDVFAAGIGHLKSHATEALMKNRIQVKEEEITWVLTVPAIWNDSARQLMREAAEKAGIPGKQLMLALEPEAASVCCAQQFQNDPDADFSTPGRFMTVDCGGGTVDISVFEVTNDERLIQLHRPDGASCGGTKVDEAFKTYLIEIIGFDGVAAFDKLDLYGLHLAFEQAKPSITSTSEKITIQVPKYLQVMLKVGLEGGEAENRPTLVKNRLMMDGNVVQGFFTKSINGITEAVERVLSGEHVGSVDTILLVGGFAESPILREGIKSKFPDKKILTPTSPASAVVMGAVLYGHKPEVIKSRIAAYTYGTNVTPLFVEGKHDPSKAFEMNGRKLCRDVFRPFIQVDQEMRVDEPLPYQSYSPNHPDQTVMRFRIYRSPDPSPQYVTDPGCEKIGEFRVDSPVAADGGKRLIHVTMSVSGTELKVIAKDERTGKEFVTKCDFLMKM